MKDQGTSPPMNKPTHFLSFVLLITTASCGGGSGSNTSSPPPPPTDPDQRADLLLSQMTLDEKFQLVHGNLTLQSGVGPRGAGFWVPGIARLGIPDLLSADGPTGVGDAVGPATALPSSLASAASWDLNEAYNYGQVIGKELSAF